LIRFVSIRTERGLAVPTKPLHEWAYEPLEKHEDIVLSFDGPVAVITLNRAETGNTLTARMIEELHDAFMRVGRERERPARAVILRAEGQDFCAGDNLAWVVEAEEGTWPDGWDRIGPLASLIRLVPQPVIGEVRGTVAGAACRLVAACDIVLAGTGARFAAPGIAKGLFATAPALELVRHLPSRRAVDWLLTGEPMPAHEALLSGLVSRVVPGEQLEAEARRVAHKIAGASFQALSVAKRAWDQFLWDRGGTTAFGYIGIPLSDCAKSADGREERQALLEGRPPVWRHG